MNVAVTHVVAYYYLRTWYASLPARNRVRMHCRRIHHLSFRREGSLPLNSASHIRHIRQRLQLTMALPRHDRTIVSIGQDEQHSNAFVRMQEIMAQNHGGFDADAHKAIDTVGWEKAWCVRPFGSRYDS